MKLIGVCSRPRDIHLEITFTATLGELMDLRAQLGKAEWPSSDFARELGELIYVAEQRFAAGDKP